MTEQKVYDFKDYRLYLEYRLNAPEAGRGSRTSLAKAIGSPVSHISQVLSGTSHLSLEQGESANAYFVHDSDESDFFLLLIQLTRAGTQSLQNRINRQVQRILSARLVIKDRIEVKRAIATEDQIEFYSSWQYQALHILATIPKYQSPSAMAERLRLSPPRVMQILEFLVSIGLIEKKGSRYQTSVQRIHLGSDSPLISKHHSNWRIKALQTLDEESVANNLHYSSVISVSEEDIRRIRDLTIEHINVTKKIIKDSPEEELYCFAIDCFKI